MSFRTVNGSTHTEDGWRCCNSDECDIVRIPGLFLTETAPLRRGAPLVILGAWLYWYDRNVEEITSSVWGWSETNDVLGAWGANMGSNHLSGTAVDVNAPKYPWGSYTMPADRIAKVQQGLQLFGGAVFWGRVWDKPDEMHYQMAWPEGDPRNDEFAQKLLDGYLGIYKPEPASEGGTTSPAGQEPASVDAAAVLAAATGLSRDRAAQILPAVQSGLALSECTTVNRIAMWLAQCGHESDGFNTTEEYAKNGRYAPYIGRTWIQITWDYNYAKFGQWAAGHGLLDDPNYFVNNPAALADMQWAGIGPAWYWTVEQPRLNEFSDAGNVEDASKAINAPAWIGTPNRANGIADRTARWNRALAQGDALLTLTTDGDDMFTDADRDLLKQIAEYRRESRSRLRWPHQGPVDTCAGFAWNADAFGHEASVDRLATTYGDPWAIANLYAVINTDEPNREGDIELAKRILAKVPKKFITAANADIQAWLDAEAQYQTADA